MADNEYVQVFALAVIGLSFLIPIVIYMYIFVQRVNWDAIFGAIFPVVLVSSIFGPPVINSFQESVGKGIVTFLMSVLIIAAIIGGYGLFIRGCGFFQEKIGKKKEAGEKKSRLNWEILGTLAKNHLVADRGLYRDRSGDFYCPDCLVSRAVAIRLRSQELHPDSRYICPACHETFVLAPKVMRK